LQFGRADCFELSRSLSVSTPGEFETEGHRSTLCFGRGKTRAQSLKNKSAEEADCHHRSTGRITHEIVLGAH
jgi:hypothetical protein